MAPEWIIGSNRKLKLRNLQGRNFEGVNFFNVYYVLDSVPVTLLRNASYYGLSLVSWGHPCSQTA